MLRIGCFARAIEEGRMLNGRITHSLMERWWMLRGRAERLKYIYIDTMGGCTNRCFMCPARQAKKRNLPMSDQTFASIVDQLREMSFDGEIHLYGQNEPLLDKQLFTRIDMVRNAIPQAKIHVISNFTFFRKDTIQALLSAPIDMLECSAYAFEQKAYEQICGRDNFRSMINNLIQFSLAWAERQPYEFSIFSLNCSANAPDRAFINYLGTLLPCVKFLQSELLSFPNQPQRKPSPWHFCPFLFNEIKIVGDGSVSLCAPDHDSSLYAGNILNEHLKDIFNGPGARRLRRDLLWRRKGLSQVHCDVCDYCYENKALYFLIWSTSLRHALAKKLRWDRGKLTQKSYTMVAHNKPECIHEKARQLTQICSSARSDYADLIQQLRDAFKQTS